MINSTCTKHAKGKWLWNLESVSIWHQALWCKTLGVMVASENLVLGRWCCLGGCRAWLAGSGRSKWALEELQPSPMSGFIISASWPSKCEQGCAQALTTRSKAAPTSHAFPSTRDWDLWRSEQNNSPSFAYVGYYVRVVRKVANTLSKGKTVTFTHQQHSVLIRGSERQLLALWVTQLKMAVWMKSNPCFRESIMKRKSIKNTMRKLLLLKPKRCWRNPKGRLYLHPDLQFLMY